jgi:hypothetical protein
MLGPEHGAIGIGVKTCTYPQSTMEVLLSREPLDPGMGASHHAQNRPIETPKPVQPHKCSETVIA